LRQLVAQAGPVRVNPPTETHLTALVRAILYQQLAGAAARAIHGRLIAALGGEVTPERFLSLSSHTLRAVGLSANKAASLRDLATKHAQKWIICAAKPAPPTTNFRRTDSALCVLTSVQCPTKVLTPCSGQGDTPDVAAGSSRWPKPGHAAGLSGTCFLISTCSVVAGSEQLERDTGRWRETGHHQRNYRIRN